MIAPLVALKKRTRLRHCPYDRPPKKRLADPRLEILAFSAISDTNSTGISESMAIPSPLEVDELMTDDSSFADVEDITSPSSEQGEGPVTLQPKVPFSARANPFVNSTDDTFLKMENYFAALLGTPGLTINDILEATFDDHEIAFITPQSGPKDIVDRQRRNTRSYYKNLEKRFKGHTNTLPFKMACLYFGFPVEPLHTGSTTPLSPAERDPMATGSESRIDPLNFLKEHNDDDNDEPIHGESSLGLRGGGGRRYAATVEDGEETPVSAPPTWRMKTGTQEQGALSGEGDKAYTTRGTGGAIQEIPAEDYPMDSVWIDNNSISLKPTPNIRLYSWQGAMDTPFDYERFVSQVDRLVSNWNREDIFICLEIWDTSSAEFIESAIGMVQHAYRNSDTDDPIWNLVQKYFGGEDLKEYACFIHAGDEDHTAEENRHGTYEPLDTDRNIVRIENAEGDVAYMRIPSVLSRDHQSHQFSKEYTRAMKVLMLPDAPHAWVSYQEGLIGDSYQYLDPPDGLWKQVIQKRLYAMDGSLAHPTISFKLVPISDDIVPVMIPGVFRSMRLPGLDRSDFSKADNMGVQRTLNKFRRAVELAMGRTDFKECTGFEVWCPGTRFKDVTQQPIPIDLPNTMDSRSVRDWQDLLAARVIPEGPFGLVVRPTYRTHQVRTPSGTVINARIQSCRIGEFKAFVQASLYNDYDPEDPSQALFLQAGVANSYQPYFTIRQETTEDEWKWILRNIIEYELVVTLERPDNNEWFIPENSIWGPRYTAKTEPELNFTEREPAPKFTTAFAGADVSDSEPLGPTNRVFGTAYTATTPLMNEATMSRDDLNFLFRNTKNTMASATKTRILRDRSFQNGPSIFTNPLKPVMPLNGTHLESIIKTGPSMPGVSIAMMTPTEMLRLQREVHSLRLQLLGRTRECPYADCGRSFTFADAAGLDRHVREDHTVLRCFLCDKDKHLLQQYNLDQIQKHFLKEHLGDIIKVHERSTTKDPPYMKTRPETRCRFFDTCGTVTSYMTEKQLAAHMKWHQSGAAFSSQANPMADEGLDDYESDIPSSISLSPFPSPSKVAEPKRQNQAERSHLPHDSAMPSVPSPFSASRATHGITPGIPGLYLSPKAPAPSPDPYVQRNEDQDTYPESSTLYTKSTTDMPTESGSLYTKSTTDAFNESGPSSFAGALDSRRKRKRPADLDMTYHRKRISASSNDDIYYEYSERSAVSDPPANIATNAAIDAEAEAEAAAAAEEEEKRESQPTPRRPRTAKKIMSAKTLPKTPAPKPMSAKVTTKEVATEAEQTPKSDPQPPATGRVTRTGRTVRATRAAREAANYAEMATAEDEEGKGKGKGKAKGKGKGKGKGRKEEETTHPKTPGRRPRG
ncbi:hypothetical protein F4861DRAFT_339470 [Xylaria intraflava]|nr:hypothetical protein F4861DRAFT_339470 [Xylaria intraflava]